VDPRWRRRLCQALASLSLLACGPAAADAGRSLALGNLAVAQRQPAQAEALYREALGASPAGSHPAFAARINLARLAEPGTRHAALAALVPELDAHPAPSARAELLLHAGHAALIAPENPALAHDAFERARALAAGAPASRTHVAALDGLARVQEARGRAEDALALGARALQAAAGAPLSAVQDLLLEIEWRQARAHRRAGRDDLALAALARAAEHAHALRSDLPIDLADGRSSYQALLQPLLETYLELQLDAVAAAPSARQPLLLARVRDAVEVLRQAEMQDFLGDRCVVDEGALRLEPGVVVLYPILLANRLELLVDNGQGLRRVTLPVPRAEVAAAAVALAAELRERGDAVRTHARRLHDWLLRPLEAELAGAHTLVVVPDGALRLVPFGALHDGERWLLERIAVTTVTGLTMTDVSRPPAGRRSALVAGIAQPGPVVHKLAASGLLRMAAAPAHEPDEDTRSVTRALEEREVTLLRDRLALPGVRDEVEAVARTLSGRLLLDDAFTVDAFQGEAAGGDYRIVHIASHGVFGGSAERSFILAFDDLLGINRLQGVLRSEKVQQTPIELLTLSACETAEGNDRAPLGIAGAAIRARAKAVLGTLWPVDDQAARAVMDRFYKTLAAGGGSKAAALRDAQLALLQAARTRHPAYWAPFNLVGNWR
jgi:CHAT domain-containing protein